jgi:hypothetical protein
MKEKVDYIGQREKKKVGNETGDKVQEVLL